MVKHHPQALKRRQVGEHFSEHKSHQPPQLISPAKPLAEDAEDIGEEDPAFLAWPSHLFEIMLTPWRGIKPKEIWKESWRDVTPLEAWVENQRSKPVFPKAEQKETDKAYFYTVALPGITRDQITLHFQGAVIMLKVTASNDQKKANRTQRSRTIQQVFTIPIYTNGEKITAELKDGVLSIIIPKADKPIPARSRTITLIV